MRSQQEMVVPSPLLRTKLYVPRSRSGLVPRPRLSERLDPGAAASKLVLVSAPAGFGKTTLLGEWLGAESSAADGRSVAWLSLDQSDNDAALFWTYLVTALETAAPGGRHRHAHAPAGAPSAPDRDVSPGGSDQEKVMTTFARACSTSK